jgi:hypothetical protein
MRRLRVVQRLVPTATAVILAVDARQDDTGSL